MPSPPRAASCPSNAITLVTLHLTLAPAPIPAWHLPQPVSISFAGTLPQGPVCPSSNSKQKLDEILTK